MTAIEKINAEMQKDPSNRNLEIIGHYLIDRAADPAVAVKLLEEDKTLKGAFNLVTEKARAQKSGNCAVLSEGEVFGEVDKYFGLPKDVSAQLKAIGLPDSVVEAYSKHSGTSGVSVNLSDFL